MQELAPPEPKQEDPFEDAEAEAAEPAAAVKQEPGQETESGEAVAGDADMADEEGAEVIDILEDEAVHMPATQDDPGFSPALHACKLHT